MQYANNTTTPFTNYNVAVGFEALRGSGTPADNTGNDNTAIGYQTLWSNTIGDFNTGNGVFALYSNTIGNNNTANGFQALSSNATGEGNTAIGYFSGNTTLGSNNLTIGANARVPTGTANNQVRIGDVNITYAGVQVAWTITSDKRWKSDIQESNLGLDFVSKLNPVSYVRNNDESKKREYGFIAQDLEEALNTSGAGGSNGIISKDDKGMYGVRYNDLMAPLVKAVQELNEELKSEVGNLKSENEELIKRIEKLELLLGVKDE